MRIELRDEFRRRIGRIDVDPAERPTRVPVPETDREVFLQWDTALDDAGRLRRCIACGCTDLHKSKAYPQVTGIVVVMAFTGAVIGVVGLATTPILIAMIIVLVLDVALLVLTRKRLVCYRCQTDFRGTPIARYHRWWDRTIAERYPRPKPPAEPDAASPSTPADTDSTPEPPRAERRTA